MAFEFISADPTSAYEVHDYDTVTLLPGVVFTSISLGLFATEDTLTAVHINLLGTLVTGGGGVFLYNLDIGESLVFSSVTVGVEGQIYSVGAGITMNDGNHNLIVNYGLISATGRGILSAGGSDNHIENHGIIFSDRLSAVYQSASGEAQNLINTGTLSGLGSAAYNAAVYTERGTVTNSGTIIGRDIYAITFASIYGTLNNSGVIVGEVTSNIDLTLTTITNSGTIQGAVRMSNFADTYADEGAGVADVVYGYGGSDIMKSADGDANFYGGSGNDTMIGRDGNDTLRGEAGDDSIRGGAGDDDLSGGTDEDLIYGGSGDDMIDGGDGADTLFGNSGDDTIVGGDGDDEMIGGSGEDNLNGNDGNDTVQGGAGNDLLRGSAGDDRIFGGAGDDILSGGTDDDYLNGGSGWDNIFGGGGNDILHGTTGNDLLNASAGDDFLYGGSDDDTLDGGTGQDMLNGGSGADVFVFDSVADSAQGSSTRDRITDFEVGVDKIDLSGLASDLVFIGSAAYSGAGNEVRYNAAIGRLYISTDADAASEFGLDLSGNPNITEDDLIL